MSVERVTKKDADGHYYMSGDGIFSDWGVPEKFKGEDVDAVGTIEDILGDTYDIDRLRELVEADKDGRCVALPCNVGDTVWILDTVRGIYSAKVRTFFVGCPSFWGDTDNAIQMIRTTECDIPIKHFGNTVFLARESAEAALAKEASQ